MILVRLLPFLGTDGACLRFHLSHSSHVLFLKNISVPHCFESQHGVSMADTWNILIVLTMCLQCLIFCSKDKDGYHSACCRV